MHKFRGLFLGLYLCSPISLANDTSVGLDSGNIYFKQSDGISMQSEDLYISPKETRVKYEFKNETVKDIKTLIGFPISPFPIEDDGDKNFDSSSNDPLNFATWVNGKKIRAKMMRKENNGQVEYTYLWEQIFPAGKTLIVEHQYHTHPSISFYAPDLDKDYCIEADAEARINQMQPSPIIHAASYILHTGANWKGAIAKFRLVVDKLRKDAVVSFCGHDIRKIAPTQFEMLKTNFKPQQDLAILFVRRDGWNW